MTRRALVLALASIAARPGVVSADDVPAPRCLPPRPDSCAPRPKKDPSARTIQPYLRPTLATLFNVHTREALALDDTPVEDEPALLARLLRDRTNWEEHSIAPSCVVTLRRACAALGGRRVEIISGYRSDKMNEMLRKKGRHVARNSQHTQGAAMDFRIVGVPTRQLLRFVRAIHMGGVGFYPLSGFVHVDAGPVRQWQGE